jgi:hypothetical protein
MNSVPPRGLYLCDYANLVRYRTKPEASDDNQRLIEAEYPDLSDDHAGRTAVGRVADGVTFVGHPCESIRIVSRTTHNER